DLVEVGVLDDDREHLRHRRRARGPRPAAGLVDRGRVRRRPGRAGEAGEQHRDRADGRPHGNALSPSPLGPHISSTGCGATMERAADDGRATTRGGLHAPVHHRHRRPPGIPGDRARGDDPAGAAAHDLDLRQRRAALHEAAVLHPEQAAQGDPAHQPHRGREREGDQAHPPARRCGRPPHLRLVREDRLRQDREAGRVLLARRSHRQGRRPGRLEPVPARERQGLALAENGGGTRAKLPRGVFRKELLKLQRQLVIMQEFVRAEGLKVVVVFEGRDAAGKGGVIKRITERTNPRALRVVALPAPTERERTQWYFQRYVAHLPAAGEIVLFDRSWYNRAGVERVMGFCTDAEYGEFMRTCPSFERMIVRSGITLVKYWFSVSDDEQERRFQARVDDPMRRWKLSPMDLESRAQWVEYSRAKDQMFALTDIPEAPWYVVEADDKR